MLSGPEMELIGNAQIILTKNEIMVKIKALLEEVHAEILWCEKSLLFEKYDESLFTIPPKISRGENYLGLPYLILDYPRNFKGEHIFAVRSFFWWGHFFSSTLHLSGAYKSCFVSKIVPAYEQLAQANYYIGIAEDAWQHHFEETNYVAIKALSVDDFSKCCYRQKHLKIATHWPLTIWNSAPPPLVESWKKLLAICFT